MNLREKPPFDRKKAYDINLMCFNLPYKAFFSIMRFPLKKKLWLYFRHHSRVMTSGTSPRL
jgi:hypothetical protein